MTEQNFSFGRNWKDFVEKEFNEERVAISQKHLLSFLGCDSLKGRSFLDIGSGSGIHSLAAMKAGADRVTSFDLDPLSVETTTRCREWYGSPETWTVKQGSILDTDFVASLDAHDIVYSWGVLHHTGDMWNAIRNAARPLAPDGIFYIALYTADVYLQRSPEYWLKKKQQYNRAAWLGKRFMEAVYGGRICLGHLKAGRNPLKEIRDYKQSRGMSFWTDVRDWLGGWPMDFARISDVRAFAGNELGLELLHLSGGEANTEYLFRPKGASNYYDAIIARRQPLPLPPPYRKREGNAWEAEIPPDLCPSDDVTDPRRSPLRLFEGDAPLGPVHAPHEQIRRYGGGAFSHWDKTLVFSTTDNTDPNTNERPYTYWTTDHPPTTAT
jgi:2-polyprenyl-3-methyl-5-hydroxy-6-metoxy-1,4-benzoquinol methylase